MLRLRKPGDRCIKTTSLARGLGEAEACAPRKFGEKENYKMPSLHPVLKTRDAVLIITASVIHTKLEDRREKTTSLTCSLVEAVC